MAQMPVAGGASHFDADHAVRNVPMLFDSVEVGGRGEAGPARAAVIFGVRLEKQRAAPRAVKAAVALFVGQAARKGALGPRLTQHMILHRPELGTPLGIGFLDFFHDVTFRLGCGVRIGLLQGHPFNQPFTIMSYFRQDMTGPGHMLRALMALGLLPLLVAAGDDACRLCKPSDAVTQAETPREIPLTLEISTKLDFSRAALSGAGGGAIDIDPMNGRRRVDGGMIDLGGSALAGTAIVRGQPGRAVRIDMPVSARMTSSTGGAVEIAALRTTLGANPRLDQSGKLEFSFGGKLLVRGNASGTFRARIPITAQYE
jgi:Domain of unknown function (DUF4402)